MEYEFAVDIHSHSNKSYDSNMDPIKMIEWAKRSGLNGLAITDHNYFSNERIKELQKKFPGFLVIPAEEIRCAKGDIIAVGLHKEIPGKLSIEETQEEIEKQNAALIVPHCYEPTRHGITRNVRLLKKPFLMETINAKSIGFANDKARRYAVKHNLAQTGGSDAHIYRLIGDAYTFTEHCKNIDELVTALRKGNCAPGGQKSNMVLRFWERFHGHKLKIKRASKNFYSKRIIR